MMALVMGSCKKTPEPPSKVDILTNGKWKLTAYDHYNAGLGYGPDDLYAPLDPCVKDNYYNFFANNTGELNEGPTKCNPSDPQVQTFTWSIGGNLFFFEGIGWEFFLTDTRLELGTKRVSGSFNGYDKTYEKF
jgi:hypothetical protein